MDIAVRHAGEEVVERPRALGGEAAVEGRVPGRLTPGAFVARVHERRPPATRDIPATLYARHPRNRCIADTRRPTHARLDTRRVGGYWVRLYSVASTNFSPHQVQGCA